MNLSQSKLFRLLGSFTAWEYRHWQDFLASPYHNKHVGLQALAGVLASAVPDMAQVEVSTLAQAVWGDAPYSERALRDLLAQLTRLTETFLALRSWEAQPQQRDQHLLAALEDRGLTDLHRQIANRSARPLAPPWDEAKLWHRYTVAASRLRIQARQPRRRPDTQLPTTATALDRWYLLQRLRYGCALLNRQTVLAQESDLALMPALLAYVERQPQAFADTPLIGAYARLFRLQESGQAAAFDQTLAFIQSHTPGLPSGSLRELYAYLMNHCIRCINAGEHTYEARLFDLYSQQLDQGILFDAGQLSPWDFKNIVSLGLKMGHYTWVQAFIQDQGASLPLNGRDEALCYNMAMLRHAQGQHQAALHLLRGVTFDDPFYELGARTTLLKIYYERGEDDSLLYHLDAFDHYLRRPRALSPDQRSLYQDLIRFTRRMVYLRTRHAHGLVPATSLMRLRQRLQQSPGVAQRHWLMAQLDTLGAPTL